jgi:solute carrier family 13 (sodium-dependent dicarboxylate transporter), member 2/3/5
LGPAAALAIALAPTPDGLGEPGQRALAVVALCVVWWLLTPVALPVTALVGLGLLPVLGVLEPADAFSLFGNQAVFFVVGVFLLAAAMLKTGLSTRMALFTLRATAQTEDRLCAAVLGLSAALCAFVVSHAVAALMLPIVVGIIDALDLGPRRRTAKRLLLSMAWGTVLGSSLTLFGSARTSLALSTYQAWGGTESIGLLEFSAATVGPLLIMLLATFLWLRVRYPPEGLAMEPALERLDLRVRELGDVGRNEVVTIGVIVLMVGVIAVWGREYGYGTLALLCSGVLFAARVLSWEQAERYVNWGIVLLYGGAIAIGATLDKTGAMAWVVDRAMPEGLGPGAALAVIALVAVGLSEFVSKAAVIALALPAVLAITPLLGLDPRAVTILMPVAAGFALSMPTSAPAMAMVYGTGYLKVRRVLLTGLPLSILGVAVLSAFALLVWPLLGLGS